MRRLVIWFLVGKVSLVVLCVMAAMMYLAVASAEHLAPPKSLVPVLERVGSTEPTGVSARAFAVFDVATGEVLFTHDADTLYPIASITKLPAAAAALVVLSPEATTTITDNDVAAEGRAGKLQVGEVYSYRELLFPLLLESSNDVSAVLERTNKTIMLAAMQNLATSYGATNVQFADLSGLSARNQASARDLTRLAGGLYADHPHVFDMTQLSQYIGPYTGWVNNSPVISEADYLGGKHGYTEAAGRTLVAFFDEPFVAGRREMGYVLLGSTNLAKDIATLRSFVAQSVRYQ